MAYINSALWEIQTGLTPANPIISLFLRTGGTGFYVDPLRGSFVFADEAGTTPATLDGALARMDSPPGSPVAVSFTQGTSASRPVLGAKGLVLDGVDDRLAMPDTPELRFGTSDLTIAAALNPDVITGQHCVLSKRGGGGPGVAPGWGMRQVNAALAFEYDFTGNVAGPAFTAVSGLTAGQWQTGIVQLTRSTGGVLGFLNNAAGTPTTITTGDITGSRDVTIGGDPGAPTTFPFDGLLGRMVVIDKVLSADDRTILNNWLAEGYA